MDRYYLFFTSPHIPTEFSQISHGHTLFIFDLSPYNNWVQSAITWTDIIYFSPLPIQQLSSVSYHMDRHYLFFTSPHITTEFSQLSHGQTLFIFHFSSYNNWVQSAITWTDIIYFSPLPIQHLSSVSYHMDRHYLYFTSPHITTEFSQLSHGQILFIFHLSSHNNWVQSALTWTDIIYFSPLI